MEKKGIREERENSNNIPAKPRSEDSKPATEKWDEGKRYPLIIRMAVRQERGITRSILY